ncbi:Panacea domain-containing protein [Hutsoniella sourekii]|uniref:Panacea domain-containing protein n=1 Tax=Hutsoniella sourekii TaxID=87650 RepID=UPI0004AE7953|nr:type II toxin-antitoxin system antitoxin SocA domain-containing protein [Hutsoniella sourekii]
MYDVEEVISWFLSKESMTPKKLQKMLYYAYSWFLTLSNENKYNLTNKLFDETFEAWVHGPVIPKVYQEYRHYGYNPINKAEEKKTTFPDEVEDILSQVYEVYGPFNGNELESISHQETPWIEARGDKAPAEICSNELSDATIFECYGSRL